MYSLIFFSANSCPAFKAGLEAAFVLAEAATNNGGGGKRYQEGGKSRTSATALLVKASFPFVRIRWEYAQVCKDREEKARRVEGRTATGARDRRAEANIPAGEEEGMERGGGGRREGRGRGWEGESRLGEKEGEGRAKGGKGFKNPCLHLGFCIYFLSFLERLWE